VAVQPPHIADRFNSAYVCAGRHILLLGPQGSRRTATRSSLRPMTLPTAPMRFRKLRITWSVMWGTLAVLLCVLWVRSYYVHDFIFKNRTPALVTMTGSNGGTVYFVRSAIWSGPVVPLYGWNYGYGEANGSHYALTWTAGAGGGPAVFLPHCFVATVVTATATVAWYASRRFTLRTLLIATTVVAILMGAIVWSIARH
jgi:hypothetical protein